MNLSKIFFTLFFGLLFGLFFFATGCGPVKFSSSSNNPPADGGANTDQNNNPNGDPNAPPPSSPPTDTGKTRDVETTRVVQSNQNKVDILLIVDNSSSMNADNIKLADRLTTFVTQLESAQIDWQMCLAITTYTTYQNYNYWGLSINWGLSDASQSSSPYYYNAPENWILKRQNGVNLASVFRYSLENNVATGSANSNDERGIKAAYWHLNYKNYNKCYRAGAAVAQIYISDEDVRSIGGIAADKYYADELKTLEADDTASALVDKLKQELGADTRFRANSIIVKPNDTACLSTQDAQGTKAHYGRKYEELSKITGGGIGSICDTDYYNNLNFFNEVINDSIASLALECNPVDNNVSVTIVPTQAVTSTVQGQSMVFSPAIKAGSTITAKYKCSVLSRNRIPNAVDGELGFFAKLYNWFISLF